MIGERPRIRKSRDPLFGGHCQPTPLLWGEGKLGYLWLRALQHDGDGGLNHPTGDIWSRVTFPPGSSHELISAPLM